MKEQWRLSLTQEKLNDRGHMSTAPEIYREEAGRLHRMVLTGLYQEEVSSTLLKMAIRFEIAALLVECSDSTIVESDVEIQLLRIH